MYQKKYNSNNIRGKLRVCNYLSKNRKLQPLVPPTVTFNESQLRTMTDRYRTVYIKLNIGSQGIGVYKVAHHPDGYELFSTRKRKQLRQVFSTRSSLYRHLKRKHPGQKLIIQKAINLDKLDDRPYDIRAMVQRKPGRSWSCTGFLVKVGAPNRIVTNYYQGGEIYTIHKLLKRKGLSAAQQTTRVNKLSSTALAISKTLSKRRKGMHEMGIDFAYDTSQKLWVLEVNSNHPQFHPLKKLDRTSYNRMRQFAKSYGRYDD